jgi:hypothetical protein
MAQSQINSGNVVTRFQEKVRREYVREGIFGKYIGASENAIIQTNKDLKKVSIPLVGKLKSAGVRGSSQLAGSEEALSNYAMTLQPTYHRNAVLIDNEENEKAEFDLFSEGKPALMNWMMELKRDQIIQALGAIEAGGTYYNYGGGAGTGSNGATAASAANMDTWVGNNSDRILYGAAKSNLVASNHTSSLANIDTTSDKLTAGRVQLLKRMAEAANPLIRPVVIKNDQPYYVFFVDSYGFRDLQADTTIATANREARPRDVEGNPIFNGGDLLYDGVIIRKVPDIDKFIDGTGTGQYDGIWGAGAASADGLDDGGNGPSRVGIGFFCGAQAVGFGIGKMAEFKRRNEDDYDHLNGVGVSAKHDIKKIFYNNKQHGMITHFYSAAADS